MEFLDARTIATIFHIFGAVLGAGGAFMSDAMFFSSIRDKRVSKTEMRFLRLGGRMVWIGLAVLFLSGPWLFFGNVDGYLASSKFLTKMTIVFVIVVNGIVFHRVHIPLLERHTDKHLPTSHEIIKNRHRLVISGAISVLSWTFTIVLGVLRSIPYTYSQAMLFYVVVVLIVSFFVSLFSHRLLGVPKRVE